MYTPYIVSLFCLTVFYALPHTTAEKQLTTCKNCTTLLPRLDVFKRHIISRRKRSIIFPKKAFVLLSQAFTKAVIDGRPPGVSYSIEFDMYSELPDTVEAWQPTLLNERLKAEQKMKADEAKASATPMPTKMPEIMPDHMSAEEFDHHTYTHDIWPNDYEYPIDFEQHEAHAPIMLTQRHFNTLYNVTHRKDYLRQKQRQKYAQDMRNLYQKHTWKSAQGKYTPLHVTENTQHWPPVEEVYESAEDVPVWKYHQAYRERRDIFEQLETLGKIFSFDMKACIQRAMCEMRSTLKPYGESLMEDIVRIILTIPKKLNFVDDYSFDFTQYPEKQPDCAKHFKKSCPYRVLDFLTATLNTASLKDHPMKS